MSTINYARTLYSFCESDCNIFFRFLRHDLQRLVELLRFPQVVRFQNRVVMPGEEIFLRGLYELCQGESKHSIAVNVFGREWSTQVRAFNYFIDHVYDNFHHLITNNLECWNFYVSLYGCQTSNYFNINLVEKYPNFLEKYIRQELW